jgi:hypothetical protein
MEDNSRAQSYYSVRNCRPGSAAVMSLMFDCTPSVRDALDSALALDSLEAPMRAEIAALAPGAPVPLSLIKSVAVAHRTAKLPRHCWVHVICAGSRPYVAPQPGVQRVRTDSHRHIREGKYFHLISHTDANLPSDDTISDQTKEFELYLERLKIKQENAVYDQMVKTTKKSSAFGEDVSISSETQSIRQQLSSGTNVIAAMATGFVLGWFLGRSMFYADSVMVLYTRPHASFVLFG